MPRRALTLATLLLGAVTATSCGDRTQVPSYPNAASSLAIVAIEQPGGVELTQHYGPGGVFVAGRAGERYNIRVTNNTPRRIEAVVTVDGRDVISGEPGDYRRQRGYVIAPGASVPIEGFRQSLEHVAAFRFSSVEASYSARRGTPQNVGVIGVAVFAEKPSKKQKSKPIAVGPAPTPAAPGSLAGERASAAPAAEPAGAGGDDGMSFEAGDAAPAEMEEAAPASKATADDAGGFAPPPEPQNELGTEYGETMSSSVHEVEFRRRKRRTPDQVIVIYYDSARGLQSRGIRVDDASPGVASGFSQPPR